MSGHIVTRVATDSGFCNPPQDWLPPRREYAPGTEWECDCGRVWVRTYSEFSDRLWVPVRGRRGRGDHMERMHDRYEVAFAQAAAAHVEPEFKRVVDGLVAELKNIGLPAEEVWRRVAVFVKDLRP